MALLRIALPSRAALLVAILAMCIGVFALAPGDDATSVDNRSMTIVLLDFGLLPVIAAMLGGALVRGEHAAWSWGLARPVGRTHWCALHFALDVATLVLGALTVDMLLGAPPHAVTFDVFRTSGLEAFQDFGVGVLALLAYLGGAFGASRGHSTLRGFPIACGWALGVFLTTAVVLWLDTFVARAFVVDAWPIPADAGLLREATNGDARSFLTPLALVLASLGGFAHVLSRALARVPGRLPRREVIAVFALWIGAVAMLTWSLRSPLWAVGDAPVLARRGDAQLEVVDPRPLPHRVVLVEAECDRCFARTTTIFANDRTAEFDDVVPGRYRVCRIEEVSDASGRRSLFFERCVDTELVSGANRIEPDFAASELAIVPADRPIGWEADQPFEHLPLLRNVAELLDRATDEPRSTTREAPRFYPRRPS